MSSRPELVRLGKTIKALRLLHGMTQAELASRMNRDQQALQRLEKGRTNPTYLTLLALSEAFGVDIKELF